MEAKVDANEWTVRLKDGTELDGRVAQATLNSIRQEATTNEELVARLYDYAQGQTDDLQEFPRRYFTDGQLRTAVKAILLNGVQRHDSGVAIHDPFGNDSDTQNVLETMHQNRAIFQQRLIDEINGPDNQPPGNLR